MFPLTPDQHGTISAVKFESFFELDNKKRTIGHSCKLIKKRFGYVTNFFTERSINVWNNLDEQTVSSCSFHLQRFRSHMMGHVWGSCVRMTPETDPEIC